MLENYFTVIYVKLHSMTPDITYGILSISKYHYSLYLIISECILLYNIINV